MKLSTCDRQLAAGAGAGVNMAAGAGVLRVFYALVIAIWVCTLFKNNKYSSNGLEYFTNQRASVKFVATARFKDNFSTVGKQRNATFNLPMRCWLRSSLAKFAKCGTVWYLLPSKPIILDTTVGVYGSCSRSGKSFELFKYDFQDTEYQHDDDLNKQDKSRICIIFDTLECTQKRIYRCSLNLTISKAKLFRVLKLKRQKGPVSYYNNSTATRRLMLSGDIEQNLGPSQQGGTVEHIPVRITRRKKRIPPTRRYNGMTY